MYCPRRSTGTDEHNPCAAIVWPGAETSSSSPSTVSNAVRSMARGSTSSPRTRNTPSASSCFWKNDETVSR